MSFPPNSEQDAQPTRWRMWPWLVLTVVLMALALLMQRLAPGDVVAVTLYKAHLMALGGWGGYWLDRALFPYERPHTQQGSPGEFDAANLRRAIVVAACLVCVGLGA